MEIIISTEPEEFEIPAGLEEDIRQAILAVGEMYDVSSAEVSLTLTDDEHIRRLNRDYRGQDRATDVLSFALNESAEPDIIGGSPINALGDIVLSLPRAEEQAKEYGHSFRREVVFLIVHGMLHLLGYDHIEEKDRLEMEQEQREVMKRLKLSRDD